MTHDEKTRLCGALRGRANGVLGMVNYAFLSACIDEIMAMPETPPPPAERIDELVARADRLIRDIDSLLNDKGSPAAASPTETDDTRKRLKTLRQDFSHKAASARHGVELAKSERNWSAVLRRSGTAAAYEEVVEMLERQFPGP
ncbi:MAG: hypothetical protein ACYCQK_01265 [Acidiferrobacteraceae bacterium]